MLPPFQPGDLVVPNQNNGPCKTGRVYPVLSCRQGHATLTKGFWLVDLDGGAARVTFLSYMLKPAEGMLKKLLAS